ncbi:hypothetical protein [Flavobacterium humi]|uniref:hypothetical protein n=1 Tax=Flavobacterium humi TaxID=2562683 RepID=UPI00146A6D00|nr:hypothetical protein [Flavobacterium humi]
MSILTKKLRIFQPSPEKQQTAESKTTEKQLTAESGITLEIAEFLLFQINSGENEILFI